MMRLQEDEVTGPSRRAAGSMVGHVGRARRGLTAPQAGGRRPAQTTGPLGISQETALASEDCRTMQETKGGNQGRRNLLRIMGTILLKRRQEIGEGGREG